MTFARVKKPAITRTRNKTLNVFVVYTLKYKQTKTNKHISTKARHLPSN